MNICFVKCIQAIFFTVSNITLRNKSITLLQKNSQDKIIYPKHENISKLVSFAVLYSMNFPPIYFSHPPK